MGTRGDIQPYIFLARGLVRNGYDVVLGSHPCWKDLVERAGIHFEPIGPDIDIEKEAAAFLTAGCLDRDVLSFTIVDSELLQPA